MAGSPCDTCVAPCCRKYSVDVTAYDAYRIGTTLRMSMADFTELVWSDTADDVRRIVFGDNDRYYRLRLQKTADEEGDKCVFLHTMKNRSYCSIYAMRPEICRTYPTYLEGGVLATSGGKYCPEGAFTIEKMDTRALRADWALRLRTRVLHDALVDGWNERVLAVKATWTHGDFYGYVTTVLRELEARVPALFERPAPGAPPTPGFDDEAIHLAVDRLLREIGWRTHETAPFARPDIGRKRNLPIIPAHAEVTPLKLDAATFAKLTAGETLGPDGTNDVRDPQGNPFVGLASEDLPGDARDPDEVIWPSS